MAFKDNIWWTRKARIKTEKRLLANAFLSQILLLWYSFSGVSAAIYYLKFDHAASSKDLVGISWVIFSILILCISGFITGLSYKERAGLVKECYEYLQTIYNRAKAPNADLESLSTEYKNILGVCENHTDTDYYIALCEAYLTHQNPKHPEPDIGLDKLPTWYHWLSVAWYFLKRGAILFIMFSLPVFIFIYLESFI